MKHFIENYKNGILGLSKYKLWCVIKNDTILHILTYVFYCDDQFYIINCHYDESQYDLIQHILYVK